MLIEYVKRIINCLKNIIETQVGPRERENFEKFIAHYVWSSKDKVGKTYYERFHNRYSEMVSRRRKLLKSLVKKELSMKSSTRIELEEIERRIAEKEENKEKKLLTLQTTNLEEMLNSSTKSVAREVVSTLVKPSERGTLQILEDILSTEFGNNGAEDASPEETTFQQKASAPRTQVSPYKQAQWQHKGQGNKVL